MPVQLFEDATPYEGEILGLPVTDVAAAAAWYGTSFGMELVDRDQSPVPRVVLQREGVKLGFAVNGGDPSQNGAVISVTDAQAARNDLESRGVEVVNWRIDERDGRRYRAFFVVAPDGLCYYFQQDVGAAD